MLEQIKKSLEQHPDRKAKEIAKQLGLTTRDVNKILHDHPNLFTQTASCTWIMKDSLLISLDDSSGNWVSSSDLENYLKKYSSLFEVSQNEIIFSLGSKKVLLNAATKLLAFCNQLSHRTNKIIAINFSSTLDPAYTYLDRAGFFDQLYPQVIVRPERPTSSRALTYQQNNIGLLELLPIYNKDGTSNQAPYKLETSYEQNINNGQRSGLHGFLGELVSNVEDHASSETPSLVGLQRYSAPLGRKKISIVISDGGKGICGTLKPILPLYYPQLAKEFHSLAADNDPKLLIKVFLDGKISCTGESERGRGFINSNIVAKRLTGSVVTIRQRNFEVILDYKNSENPISSWNLNLTELDGTHISLDYFLTNDQ
ncbi:MAG: hypothetical protein EOO69_02485 [Moraxellaceae bacterium]|nr:MAG: hypothetical protein EOO69_02485 [Moraxellaceae bacterium]